MTKAELYHCKAMTGENYGSNVSDVYEVAQPSIKGTVLSAASFYVRNTEKSKAVENHRYES